MEKEKHNEIWSEIKNMKDNHILHLTEDMAEVKTNIAWLMENHRAMRTMLYSILGGIILTIILVVMKLQ